MTEGFGIQLLHRHASMRPEQIVTLLLIILMVAVKTLYVTFYLESPILLERQWHRICLNSFTVILLCICKFRKVFAVSYVWHLRLSNSRLQQDFAKIVSSSHVEKITMHQIWCFWNEIIYVVFFSLNHKTRLNCRPEKYWCENK